MSVQTHQIWNTTAFKAASSKIFQSVMNADGKPPRKNSKRRHIGVLKHCSAYVHKHGTFRADVPGLGPNCRACGGMYHPWNECAVGVSLIPYLSNRVQNTILLDVEYLLVLLRNNKNLYLDPWLTRAYPDSRVNILLSAEEPEMIWPKLTAKRPALCARERVFRPLVFYQSFPIGAARFGRLR
ncbi:hypothetical protein B0H10DRAFT_1967565 [Mycena sp. CBHHK59/15]|nr:hypothetical protein B0H10DRAFT_1967565 [Mycena sp. CBHHK59/15]